MKRMIWGFILNLSSLVTYASSPSRTGSIFVEILNLHSDQGTIRATLDRTPDEFSGVKQSAITATAKITQGKAFLSFPSIPRGKYAIKIFHDENDNEILDLNWLGIPSEPYGISNNARAAFGLPTFKSARFSLDKESVTLQIEARIHLSLRS